MIQNFFRQLRKRALSEIGSKLCEGKEDFLKSGFQRDDCYHVVIGRGLRTLPFKVVWEVNEYLLTVKDGKETLLEYGKQPLKEIDWRGLPSRDFQILHYYKGAELKYNGMNAFLIQRMVPYRYVLPYCSHALQDARAFLYGRKRFVTKTRIDLLRVAIDSYFQSGGKGVNPSGFAERLHGELFFLHPEYEKEMEKISTYLRVLNDGDLLTGGPVEYSPTGLAIEYVERYDQEERRHKQLVTLQVVISLLTAALVFLAAVQSKVVKLPTLLDLT